MKTRFLPFAGLLVLASVVAAVSLPGSATSAAAETGGITVQGTGSVAIAPDRAELSFGVESQGQTATAALAANAAEMRRVIAAVKAAGGANVTTQSVSLSPRYDEQNQVQAFVATNTVSATVKEIEAAVADARASAQALASASGLSLGRITAVVEGGGSDPQPYAVAQKAMDAGSTPIEPGTQQGTAVVSVTFSAS